ncbi:hypothetical protein CF327_g213 [Tilletia walkeri]|nr:hypothetical protein CF327_g213 [Tilletia walkeri]
MAHIPAPSRYRQGGGSSSSSSSQPQRETNHILQDSQPRTPISWTPSLGLAFRLILIVRLLGARFSIISDCDETYNYWEALHLLVFPPSAATSNSSGAGLSLLPFQTWEYAPQFAIRSYAYLLPYLGFVKVAGSIVPLNKINTFFVLRNMLAVISSLVEAKFCVAVGESIHPRVAKYLFVFLLTSAGMSSAATGLLPSTFTMYTTTLALAYAFYPSRLASPNPIPAPSNLTLSQTPFLRTLIATATFALGALLGWPFAIVLSLPFVLEEILLPSGNSVPGSFSRYSSFVSARLRRFILGALLSGITIGGLTIVIDTLAYGKLTVVPLGIVMYNVLSAQRGAGPELYGIEPASYYFANLGLAFNIALPLALLSAPLVILTAVVDPKQLGPPSRTFPLAAKEKKDTLVSSSRMTLLLVRLAPFYTWLGLLTAQSHKEERFMFPAYPLVCFNAAVAVYLGRALLVKLLATSPTSRNQQAPSSLPSKLTTFLLLTTTLLSLLRTIHLQSSFYAPTAILEHFTNREIPHLIGRAFPLSITAPVAKTRIAAGLDAFVREEDERAARIKQGGGVQTEGMFGKLQDRFRVTAEPARLPSLTGLVNMSVLLTEFGAGDGKPAPLRLCYGKEWYRFPGHFFVPHGVGVDFVKSEFTGILPKHYRASGTATELRGWEKKVVDGLDRTLGWSWGLKDVTRTVQDGFNDMNREEPDRYVDINTCDYLVDLDHPHRFASADPKRSSLEPRHAIDSDRWTRVHCIPFLDSAAPSPPKINGGGSLSKIVRKVLAVLDRTLYVPGPNITQTFESNAFTLLSLS